MDEDRKDLVRVSLMHLKANHQRMDFGEVIDILIKVTMIIADEVTS